MSQGGFLGLGSEPEGMCRHCGADECIGLANGMGFCTICQREFEPRMAETPEEAEFYAKHSLEWRAKARAIERHQGHKAASFAHGCANLWGSMVPKDKEPDTQVPMFPPSQEQTDG